MKRIFGIIWLGTVLSAVGIAACGSSSTSPSVPSGVAALRQSLEAYSSFTLAKNAGYGTAITDCMSHGDDGAMGIHYANTSLIDGVADSLHPEALIYEPGNNGEVSLVGVEFIVPFAVVSRQSTPPITCGRIAAIRRDCLPRGTRGCTAEFGGQYRLSIVQVGSP